MLLFKQSNTKERRSEKANGSIEGSSSEEEPKDHEKKKIRQLDEERDEQAVTCKGGSPMGAFLAIDPSPLFPLMRHDGTVLGMSTIEAINSLVDRRLIEECYNPLSGVIFYAPTMMGLKVMAEHTEKIKLRP